jgi:hypothetical protein
LIRTVESFEIFRGLGGHPGQGKFEAGMLGEESGALARGEIVAEVPFEHGKRTFQEPLKNLQMTSFEDFGNALGRKARG